MTSEISSSQWPVYPQSARVFSSIPARREDAGPFAALSAHLSRLQQARLSSPSRNQAIENLRKTLERELRDAFFISSLRVDLFGSFLTGLSSETSDADFTLMVNRSVSQPVPSIEALGSRLRLRGYQQVITIPKAFVPIVTFYDPSSGTHCDISINQPLGVHNSRLIKTYSDIDDRFKTLAVAVRQLAKNKGILDGKQGFLSSYALVLMVITFLQDVTEPPILPALQPKAVSDTVYDPFIGLSLESVMPTLLQGQTRKIVDGHDCTFDDNVANYLNFGKDNKKSTGELLVDFCRYFGHQFLYSEQEVNPRMGKIRARPAIDRHFTRAGLFRQPGEHFVCIMDPFIVSRNVARNCRGLKAGIVQATFKEAHTALQAGNILSVLGQ